MLQKVIGANGRLSFNQNEALIYVGGEFPEHCLIEMVAVAHYLICNTSASSFGWATNGLRRE